MTFVKIEGAEYVRDTNSMGLSNTNISEKNEYYSKLRLMRNQKEEMNKLQGEINDIRTDISELKSLLIEMVKDKHK